MNNSRLTVVIIYHYFAHYRLGILKELNKYYNLYLIGSTYQQNGIELIDKGDFNFVEIKNLHVNGFLYQRGVTKALKGIDADRMIFLGDWKILSTWKFLILNPNYRRIAYWWGHGHGGCKDYIEPWRKYFYRLFRGGLVYSQYAKTLLEEDGVKNISYISNSIKGSDIVRLKKINKRKKFVFIGRLIGGRGLEELIAVFDSTPEADLFIVGDGEFDSTKVLSSNITFVGALYNDDLDHFMENMDVMIFPGRIGLSLIHAFSFGLPVMLKDHGICNKPEFEAFEDGVNGFKYHDENVLEVLERFMKLPKETYLKMSNNARKMYMLYYSPKVQLKLMINALSSEKN